MLLWRQIQWLLEILVNERGLGFRVRSVERVVVFCQNGANLAVSFALLFLLYFNAFNFFTWSCANMDQVRWHFDERNFLWRTLKRWLNLGAVDHVCHACAVGVLFGLGVKLRTELSSRIGQRSNVWINSLARRGGIDCAFKFRLFILIIFDDDPRRAVVSLIRFSRFRLDRYLRRRTLVQTGNDRR